MHATPSLGRLEDADHPDLHHIFPWNGLVLDNGLVHSQFFCHVLEHVSGVVLIGAAYPRHTGDEYGVAKNPVKTETFSSLPLQEKHVAWRKHVEEVRGNLPLRLRRVLLLRPHFSPSQCNISAMILALCVSKS